jgi:hypothetical protein
MMFGNQLYELGQIREQEYMHEAELRRGIRSRVNRQVPGGRSASVRRLRRSLRLSHD